jgi:hypothetical protein
VPRQIGHAVQWGREARALSYGTEYPYEVEHDELPEQERISEIAEESIHSPTVGDLSRENVGTAVGLLVRCYTVGEPDIDRDGFIEGVPESFRIDPRQAVAEAKALDLLVRIARSSSSGVRFIRPMRPRGRGRERRPSSRRRTRAAARSPGRSTDDGPLPLAHSHRRLAGVAT